MKIAVIGAGIAGILPAYYLAKQGHRVRIYEQERYPAMRTSYANGGQISVSNSETWNSWNNVIKGIKWLAKKDAPLLIRPSLDWDKAVWLAKFLYHTALNDQARNTAKTIHLGLTARKLYSDIVKEEGLEFDQSYCGILHFYKDSNYFQHAIRSKQMYEDNGCEWQILTPDEVSTIEPKLQSNLGIIGGAWTPSDWTGDIHKFCVEMARVLKHMYRVEFCFNEHPETDELLDWADKIVVAAGIGSVKLAKMFGDSLPIYPVKGYSITISVNDTISYNALPKVSLLDDQAKIVTSTLGNKLRVAGTAELAGENYDIRRDRIQPLLKWVETNFPSVSTKDYSSWACLRPMTPNMMPIVKQGKNPKVFYHTGHGHLGWTLSPATAKQLVDLININTELEK
jgi:D-amino-acid dehydrogenase